MDKFILYFRYALRSFIRGRSRSLFDAFCVSVGVASVVALGMAGGNFQSAMTGSAQKQNRGDISVSPPGQSLSLNQYAVFAQMKAEDRITDYTPRLQDDAILRATGKHDFSTIGSLTALDPTKFPFYDAITADQPAGVSLAKLLSHPNHAAVGHDVFTSLHLTVGGQFAVDSKRGFSHVYTVLGGLLLLGTLLAMGASSLTALPASSEKPMNVLRYE
jgi:ABC-type lipoprotein release transport system permease subunit